MKIQTAPGTPDSAAPAQFSIPAKESLQEQRPATLKHGDTFAVFNHYGDVLQAGGRAEGLYHRDTRYLSHFDLLLERTRPILLSSTLREDNAALTCDLTNADFETDQGVLEHDLIHLRRAKFLWNATCFERVSIRNFAPSRQELSLEIRFSADFADLFEVRGTHRARRGRFHPPVVERDSVTMAYTGLDQRRRTTRIRFEPAPDRIEFSRAIFCLRLAPGEHAVLHIEIACDQPRPARPPRETFLGSIRDARRALRTASSRAASIETSNDIFNEGVRRSVSDLYMLVTDTPQGPYPYAGIPWFSAAFGRDAIITALSMLWMDPAIARGVLRYLAANQARETDPAADAEPGKILHEVRHGEMAELGEVPFRRYYGSVDSTPLFVMLAGEYLARTGDRETARALWPNVEAALRWIDTHGDRDGDGFVEYFRRTEKGLANQGWKDSHDSVFHADGSAAQGPIALCEVQAYVYAARRAAARIARALDDAERAAALDTQAEQLRERFEATFWCEELGIYALALDGRKRPCAVRSSNAGHALLAGIAAPERARRMVDCLTGSAFFSGWGIRTIASGEVRYNPMSYHNGSVWPHDNALIAQGFSRYGFRRQAARILEGMFAASTHIELRRLPELFCGFPRRRGQGPTFYPVACVPQAWAAAAPLSLLQSCLGIGFDPPTRTVFFHHPTLPDFLDRVILRGLKLGDASMDVELARSGQAVGMSVRARSGEIRATMTS